jgi:ParB-like chromosome segregation protein Spo0J
MKEDWTMTTQRKLRAHPAADALPDMSETEYRELKRDISANGLRLPIVLCAGQILDGRHRYRACRELGIEPRFDSYLGDDPIGQVVSLNIHRRHLNPGQLALIGADLVAIKGGDDRARAQNCALTHAKAAKLLGVSERSVDTASALNNGVAAGRVIPKLPVLVKAGHIRLARAAKVARMPLKQQVEVAAQSGDHAKAAGTPRPKPWTRQCDEIVRDVRKLCFEMEQLTACAAKAGKLTTGLSDRLIETCRHAEQLFGAEVCCLEERAARFARFHGGESSDEKESVSYGLANCDTREEASL